MILRLLRHQYSRLILSTPVRPTIVASAYATPTVACGYAQQHVRRKTDTSTRSHRTALHNVEPARILQKYSEEQAEDKRTQVDGTAAHPEQDRRNSWMRRVERFLPPHLRNKTASESLVDQNILTLVNIMDRARAKIGTEFDILEYMLVDYGRDEAVLSLLDELLKVVGPYATSSAALPSNIQWPAALFDGELLDTFDVEPPVQALRGHSSIEQLYSDESLPDTKQLTSTMRQVWLSLGRIVIAATKMESAKSQQTMSVVYRALAKIHHYGLVPDAVYSYQPTPYSSTLNRPPIIHLLSSRILTTLSDAVWRSQQKELIAKATETGVPLKRLSRDPPGGRFRLKVREMGPEVWLEFILWCCVEGPYASSGAKIIDLLHSAADNTWFAVNWTSNDIGRSVPLVDWSRVNSRHGGTVGRIEGYSREKPLADVPERTISAEVVLALAESILSASDVRDSGRLQTLEPTARSVRSVISFLEPHSLPPEYFDYLSVRLLQNTTIDCDAQPRSFNAWIQAMNDLRDLESVHAQPEPEMSLAYPAIVSQSLLCSALMHQLLTAYIHKDHYLRSLDAFTRLQYQIDKTKLQNVIGFVQGKQDDAGDPHDRAASADQLEYVHSYGELPQHGKAAFLQYMTVNRQFDIATWMVYSKDVDGPLIPPHTYGEISIAAAVVRLAAELQDETILARIADVGRRWRFKPAVKLLRHIVDAHVRRLDFHRAELILDQLRDSIAGGYSPGNLATLASVILRLQVSASKSPDETVRRNSLQQALSLFHRILGGGYDCTSGDFYRTQMILFRQQVGHILRVLESLPQSQMHRAVKQFSPRYPTGNSPNLVPAVFNNLLSGVVESLGVQAGCKVWELFCQVSGGIPLVDNDHQDLESFLSDAPIEGDDEYFQDQDARGNEATDNGTGVYAGLPANPDRTGVTASYNMSESGGGSQEAIAADSEVPWSDLSLSVSSDFNDAFGLATFNPELLAYGSGGAGDSADRDQHVTPKVLQHVQDGTTSARPSVIPNLASVRVILRGALQQPESTHREHLVQWAASLLRHFGLTDEDIQQETRLDGNMAPNMTEDAHMYSATPPNDDQTVSVRKHWATGTEHIHRKREVLWRNSLRVG